MQRARVAFGGDPVAVWLRKFVVRLHPHPVIGGAPADILKRQRDVRRHPRLAVQQARKRSALAAEMHRRLGYVPARIVHVPTGEFAKVRRVLHRADAIVRNVVHGQHSLRSVVVDQVHVHGLAVLEAEHHAPVTRDPDALLARAVALEGMQPKSRRVGAARMRRLLQTEQDTRSRGVRSTGSRALSSRSCSARSPLCPILIIHCGASRYTPQSPAVPSRPAATMRAF